ncbi:MAG TPA: rhodanese-like domain-containing protein [Gammaproteobacteria bacterium]|nr:rhodanese-like domain-containing protein [Gammaproteobacteria bacterium]
MQEIRPGELARKLRGDSEPPLVLDVREPWEHEFARIEGAELIPMGEVPARLNDFDPERETVVICHYGSRSAQIASLLESAGLRRVLNLQGGIDAWSREVDRSVPRY